LRVSLLSNGRYNPIAAWDLRQSHAPCLPSPSDAPQRVSTIRTARDPINWPISTFYISGIFFFMCGWRATAGVSVQW